MSELTQREKDLGWCEEAQTYCSVAEERYQQGRADKLEEVKEVLSTMVIHEVIDNFAYEQIMVQIGADE